MSYSPPPSRSEFSWIVSLHSFTFSKAVGSQGVDSIEQLTSRDLDRLAAELLDQGGARGELSRASAWTLGVACQVLQ